MSASLNSVSGNLATRVDGVSSLSSREDLVRDESLSEHGFFYHSSQHILL